MSKLSYQAQDEYGTVTVYDDGECYILSFATHDEQSRCLKAAPHILQYDYTQAMLLVLLFCYPKRVLLLGLGGGSLASALYHAVAGIHITAVELRAPVIEAAQRYFQLPRAKRIEVIQQNADMFLLDNNMRKVDVIFADLYDATGTAAMQLRVDFIRRCAELLKEQGWLVLNCWQEQQDNPCFCNALREHFADLRYVLTGSKNWVILAGKVADDQTNNLLKETAASWSGKLEFSLHKHLARLRYLEV
ncbi:methyltransferase domain-containing protein [uncultured Thiothrix sp.]|uniref:spermidine synthase n=1 Tax=uncultured Thiothrix sp. TaxID=223185 RepID=UPI00262C0BD1|nr:methyltransferase domain-containing protein [uncultured Thiothrix sp.]HMT93101.1 methyltransferase domain-containing protein [Thiolinea sp.]